MSATPKVLSNATPGTTRRPTGTRHVVVAFVVVLAVITYIDRVCISQAAPEITRDLQLTEVQKGWMFSAFTIAYALFEIPGGRWGDRYGPRSVLMKVVVMWSVFTAATGAAWNFVSMIAFRFLFGAGEAGCFPNVTKIFTIWLPHSERVRAQGILWLSARWGGAFTPALVVFVLWLMSWRYAFGVFGLLGIVWAVVFYVWFRDNPREHPGVNDAELALLDGMAANSPTHDAIPWREMLGSRSIWLLWLQYFCSAYGWYFYITFLPTYLKYLDSLRAEEAFDSVANTPAVPPYLAGLPLFLGGIGCFAGGWLARRLARAWGRVGLPRRVLACIGYVGAGTMFLAATQTDRPLLIVYLFGMAGFFSDLGMAPSWGACMDIGGRHAGAVSGSMNMVGNLGGAVGPVVMGYLLAYGEKIATVPKVNPGWTIAFFVSAAVYAVAALSWLLIDPVTSLESMDYERGNERSEAR